MNPEEVVPNDYLRRARSLKGWSQAELAEQIGTSFEMVSRWERGISFPGPYYRERLCATLGATAEELGFVRNLEASLTQLPSPLIFLASSHVDAEKTIVSHLKTAFQERGITLWSSRQFGRQETNIARPALREAIRNAQVILVIISPETRSSRYIREALEIARQYQRPVCGVWIEGEDWREYLPEDNSELATPIDARKGFDAALSQEVTVALKRVGIHSSDTGIPAPEVSNTGVEPLPATLPSALEATIPVRQRTRSFSGITKGLLIGLAVLVIAGGILGSLRLFGMFGARSGTPTAAVVRGGTWTDDSVGDTRSLIANGPLSVAGSQIMQALYLPLFYGDPQGAIHPGAATEIPTVQNGGISAGATIWTFHLRPHLVWSDGQPYDARDVDYTLKLRRNPAFSARIPIIGPIGLELISSVDVSADYLSITFHLKRSYIPFLQYWVDAYFAPLPAHHFSSMAPDQILKSPDNLNPQVVSGPFMMAESEPGDHYTVVRNPRYYRAREGLPYLDKIVFRIVDGGDIILKDLQAGTIDSAYFLDVSKMQAYQQLHGYTLITPPTSNNFEALYFNFHNTVLASHPEVRQAMAMAVDHQALVQANPQGLATPLCTDHGSFYHPGYEPNPPCPVFDPVAANKLLDDNGWAKGPDRVRTRGNERLEFEYSVQAGGIDDTNVEVIVQRIIQRNMQAIGIKLDIQNYPHPTFFPFLSEGKASPATGAVAGRYDIAEVLNFFAYDPDDSSLLACDQIYPNGGNIDFYCNPALDALYSQELTTADPGERQQLFNQIHQLYLTEFPFITLYSPLDLDIVRKGTHHNYIPSPYDGPAINIWEWWCDNGKC
jgi:peptide/nickel transport system substrate-binding protein